MFYLDTANNTDVICVELAEGRRRRVRAPQPPLIMVGAGRCYLGLAQPNILNLETGRVTEYKSNPVAAQYNFNENLILCKRFNW